MKMTPAQVDAFLGETRIAKLVTLYADGRPTSVPVWFEWDGAAARLFTSVDSEKVGRIRADPRVCLSVEEPAGVDEAWVTIEGNATIETEGGMELARRLAHRYYSPEKAAATLPGWERMAAKWVVVTIAPTRIRSLAPG
ncbi:MAG: TIGR03618 family F420-dependent PPOX class oxidoreductase [Chloroflexi bacterium]|nr:TIGR03618 family F420-dependent PPOX class oxidoreductase [Chloroflexota bacterium]